MMETPSFCDYFWGSKNHGYDTLLQNFYNGAKASKEFIEYLREMSSLEESCCKSWLKMSKLINPSTSGSIQPLWEGLRDYSLNKYNIHYELNQSIQNFLRLVQKYTEEQQTKQRSNKENDTQTQQIINLFITNASQLEKAKQSYDSRYIELYKLHKNEEQSPGSKTREIEKQETKLKKAVDEYKYQIEKYNNTCTKFKTKMLESSQNFQEMEQYHLIQMKTFLQNLLSSFNKSHQKHDNVLKKFEKVNDRCSVKHLIEVFIKLRTTGTDIPKNVQFEEYNEARNNSLNDSITPSSQNSIPNSISLDNETNNVLTGNLLDLSTPPTPTITTNDQLNNDTTSEHNSINNEINMPTLNTTPATAKKQTKKYNNIFRRIRNSPTNNINTTPNTTSGTISGATHSVSGTDKDKNDTHGMELQVDEEGYSIRPPDVWPEPVKDDSSNSSSDEDDDGPFKGIKINIRPAVVSADPNKSDNSSINEEIGCNSSGIATNDDLIKAVQTLKLSSIMQSSPVQSSSRSQTPASVILDSTTIRDSRRQRAATAMAQPIATNQQNNKLISQNKSELKNSSVSPPPTINFDVSFDDENFDDLSGTIKQAPQFSSSISSDKASSNLDPWGLNTPTKTPLAQHPDQPPPPPLPMKISPPKNASNVSLNKENNKVHPNMSSLVTRAIPPIPDSLSHKPIAPPPPPPPSTLSILEGIPLAIAFTETLNAKFRHQSHHNYHGPHNQYITAPHDVQTSGRLVVSFPSSMIQQFEMIGGGIDQLKMMEPVKFCLTRAARLRNIEPCKNSLQFIKVTENQSDDNYVIQVDLNGLYQRLKPQHTAQPHSPFFNIDLIQYDVTNSVRDTGLINAPINLTANWQFTQPPMSASSASASSSPSNITDNSTTTSHLVINYSWNWPHTEVGMLTFRQLGTSIQPNWQNNPSLDCGQVRGEIRFLVVADGKPNKVQSLPPCIWNSDLCRASWRFELDGQMPDLTSASLDKSNNMNSTSNSIASAKVVGPRGSACIKAKFSGMNSTGTLISQPVACQFSVEGAIESGVGLEVRSNVFRISRHKYRLISGRYVWEPITTHPQNSTPPLSSTTATTATSTTTTAPSNTNNPGFCV